MPTARARSQMTGKTIDTIEWGPNWDDNLGGSLETMHEDPTLSKMQSPVQTSIEEAFMFYLPRLAYVRLRMPLQEGLLQPLNR